MLSFTCTEPPRENGGPGAWLDTYVTHVSTNECMIAEITNLPADATTGWVVLGLAKQRR